MIYCCVIFLSFLYFVFSVLIFWIKLWICFFCFFLIWIKFWFLICRVLILVFVFRVFYLGDFWVFVMFDEVGRVGEIWLFILEFCGDRGGEKFFFEGKEYFCFLERKVFLDVLRFILEGMWFCGLKVWFFWGWFGVWKRINKKLK